MKVSYKWLSEWVDLNGITPEQIADKLTNAGIEVDAIIRVGEDIENVVVGKVLQTEQHSDADKLKVCVVDVGEQETLQIVCGAANVAAGQLVPVAKIGAVLPGNFKIKKTKLRGVESEGMICSAKELGIDSKYVPKELQDGIYVIQEEYQLGTDIKIVFNMDDVILDLDLTPNRSDCLSLRGVAYELSALFNRSINTPQNNLIENDEHIDDLISLEVINKDLCPRYTGRIIKNITVKPSPMWLRNKLQAAGIRSINNIVDITNLILIEYGQPLHAFDYNKINGQKIIVRRANENEQIKTLDEIDRQLKQDMLVIADDNSAVAIAGVMGGFESEVTDKTVDVLIESAYFDSSTVRKTSTAFGLRSEASIRFEKGTDPSVIIEALDRATMLMVELAGGEVVGGIIDANNIQESKTQITVSVEQINNRLGTDLTKDSIIDIFKSLQFSVKEISEIDNVKTLLEVTVPSRRQDIKIVEDLSEEVARLYGYINIPTTLPISQSTQGGLTTEQKARRRLRNFLISVGFSEAVSYSFINANSVNKLKLFDDKYQQMIPLKMPMSEERSVLRTTMLPSMLELAEYNNNHKNETIKLFELGKVYIPAQLPIQKLPTEKIMLAGIAYGKTVDTHWSTKQIPIDFYYIKGVVEGVFAYFGIETNSVEYKLANLPSMHPGQTAQITIDSLSIGYIGQIHPDVIKEYDLPKTFYFEIEYETLLKLSALKIAVERLPKYPAIDRDIAVVINQDIPANDVKAAIITNGGDLLKETQLFDVYTGIGIEEGKKSLAFSLKFNDSNKTLTDEEVQTVINKILKVLENNFQAELRN